MWPICPTEQAILSCHLELNYILAIKIQFYDILMTGSSVNKQNNHMKILVSCSYFMLGICINKQQVMRAGQSLYAKTRTDLLCS